MSPARRADTDYPSEARLSDDLWHSIPPRTTLPDEVPVEEQALLSIIEGPTLKDFKPPMWHHVEDRCEELGLGEATEIMKALPQVGMGGHAVGPCYGFTVPPRYPIGDEEQIRLTIGASLVLPDFRKQIGEPFVHALKFMIKLNDKRPRDPHEKTYGVLTSENLRLALPEAPTGFIKAFPSLLDTEPYIRHAGGSYGDDSWTRNIDRTITWYRGVETVEDYIAKTCEMTVASAAAYPKAYAPAPPTVTYSGPSDFLPVPDTGRVVTVPKDAPIPPAPVTEARAEPGPYVDLQLLKDLEEAGAKTKWSVDKLLRLAAELNSNFADGNFYTCLALVRAIGDHIPPVFGKRTWPDLYSSYKWTRPQDKSYADTLNWYRDPANDVLHRPMGETASRIAQGDVPPRHALNGVLQELLLLLKAQATGK